ncbi:MAG: sulfite exporter TauE/SafE family protein [Methanocellales archaeon]
MDLSLLIALFLIAFIAGILGAMLGLGGGFFVIPVLTLALNIPIHLAIGASIIGVIATSSAAATVYVQEQLVNVKLAMILETATTVGGIIGAFIAVYLNQRVLSLIFALFMIYAAYSMLSQPEKKHINIARRGLRGRYYDKPWLRGRVLRYCD